MTAKNEKRPLISGKSSERLKSTGKTPIRNYYIRYGLLCQIKNLSGGPFCSDECYKQFMDEFNEQVDSLNNEIPEDYFDVGGGETENSIGQGGYSIDNIYEQKNSPTLK